MFEDGIGGDALNAIVTDLASDRVYGFIVLRASRRRSTNDDRMAFSNPTVPFAYRQPRACRVP